jgi:hypothetical protein
MVHATGDNPISATLNIRTQHFVPMPFDSAKNGNANISFNIPEAQRVVLYSKFKIKINMSSHNVLTLNHNP